MCIRQATRFAGYAGASRNGECEMFRRVLSALVLAAVTGLLSPFARADVLTLQPDATGVDDVFLYAGFPTTNFQVGFPTYAPLLGASYFPIGGDHTTQSYIRFSDFSSLPVFNQNEVASVTLGLTTRPILAGTGEDPNSSNPVTISLYEVSADWSENTLTWNNKPGIGLSPLSTNTITAVAADNSIVSTWNIPVALFLSWLNSPSTNYGVAITRDAADWRGAGPPPDDYGVMFRSSDYATASARPFLQIVTAPIPEPTSFAVLVLGATLVQSRRRRA